MKPIVPMEPKATDIVPEGNDWLAQVKWDGVHILTYYDEKEVELYNRKLHRRTFHYPEITNLKSYCNAFSVILDGEMIALGQDGKPSFHEIMRRDGIRRMERIEQVKKVVPVTYMIFDVLYLNGKWMTNEPLEKRIEILYDIITPNKHVQLVSSHPDGESLFRAIEENGMEGIVMKNKNSVYTVGAKKDVWLKIKNYRDVIAVIGGFTLNGGVVNSILVGLYDQQGKLQYVGHTGTGKMSKEDWRKLTERLKPLVIKDRPFTNIPQRHRDAYWVQPKITAKIQFANWTEDGSLRQPSIQSFLDVPPEQCIFDQSTTHH